MYRRRNWVTNKAFASDHTPIVSDFTDKSLPSTPPRWWDLLSLYCMPDTVVRYCVVILVSIFILHMQKRRLWKVQKANNTQTCQEHKVIGRSRTQIQLLSSSKEWVLFAFPHCFFNTFFVQVFFFFLASACMLVRLSSPVRDRTPPLAVKAWSLSPWATREFQQVFSQRKMFCVGAFFLGEHRSQRRWSGASLLLKASVLRVVGGCFWSPWGV